MTVGIEFTWAKCPEGAHIIDHGERKIDPDPNKTLLSGEWQTGRWMHNRTKNLVGYRRHLTDLKSGTMLESFVNADTIRKLEDFVSEYGMLTSREKDVQAVPLETIAGFRQGFMELFEFHGDGKKVEAIDTFNKIVNASQGTHLIPRLSYNRLTDSAVMTFEPKTPYGYMLMEASIVISNATELRTCQHCGTAFFAGALTSKRTNAYFCSNRCRVAAQRARA
ncbi:hypothetical protein LMIY3S_04767 [Labrys miyagiensis]